MSEKRYLYLLILCEIWCLGILEALADEEIQESSDLLVRQKRVISSLPNEDVPLPITNASYVAIIKQNGRIKCVGSVLSKHVVITASSCVHQNPENYQLSCGQGDSSRGVNNFVIEIRIHLNIALLTVNHPFVLSTVCNSIPLHVGHLLPGVVGKVRGWGFNFRSNQRGTNIPTKLRSIEVPIISHRECVNRYGRSFPITEQEVCTYHPDRRCGHTDVGAGLVIGQALAGVHLRSELNLGGVNPPFPDVFAIVQDLQYRRWITSNVREIDLVMGNRQHPLYPHHA